MSDEIIQVMSVNDVEFRSGKKGWKFNERFNIFDKQLAEQLRSGIGQAFKFDVQMDSTGKYENVRQMGTPIGDMPAQGPYKQDSPIVEFTKDNGESEFMPIKQNSRTWGKGDDQVKLYFLDVHDLDRQVRDLDSVGLMPKAYVAEPKPVDPKDVLEYLKTRPDGVWKSELETMFGEVTGELTKLLAEGVIFEEKPNYFKYLG